LGQPGGLAEESKAAAFNGSTGTAQAELDLSGQHKLTVEFWMKWSAYADDDALAMEFTPNFNANPGGFLIDPDASTGNFGVGVGEGSTRNNVYFTRPSAGAWHHYAFVIDTEAAGEHEITPYVDGHPVSYTKTESNTGGAFAKSTLYWMSRDAASLFGGGAMQDLAVYTHALSATEVLEHYETGAGGPKASFSHTPVSASAGVPVNFNASASSSPGGAITDYAWDFNGGKGYGTDAGSSSSTAHTFSAPGTYTIDLRVKDALGKTGTTSKTIVVGPALGAYAQAVEGTSGVAHFWPMEESSGSAFADLVGGADASIAGGVTLGNAGGLAEESKAAAFNGSTGTAQAELDLSSTHKLTVEFWMKWNAYADDDSLAMEFTPNFNTIPGGFLIDPDASTGNFGVGVGEGSTRNNVYFTRPSAGAWHHYAFVIDTEAAGEHEITPYVDGHAVSFSKTESNTGGAFAKSTLYWMSRDAASLFGGGAMQDLAIYTHALSTTEVLEHYATGAGGPKASLSSSPVSASAGVPVNFDASASTSPGGAITDYAWDFDGGKGYGSDTGSTSSASHTFSTPGTYTVDLRVKDALGEAATTSKTIVVGPALGAYAQAVEGTSGVAHFWPMEESSGSAFADLVGGADASIAGGVTLGQPGGLAEESKAAGFNGSTGTAQAELDLSGQHKLTVEFWMKWNAYADDDALAMEFTPNFNTNPGGFFIDPDASTGNFGVGIGEGSTRNNVYFSRPSAGAWHHYTFVIDTEATGEHEITPYVDGHAVSFSKTESNTGGAFAKSTLYWMSRDAASLFGGGAMQDLAIYTHALSATEVLEHYETGAGGPRNTMRPAISGEPALGQTLTSTSGTWAGDTPISYAYQWERCENATLAPGTEATGEGIAVDQHGNVWISETYQSRLRETNKNGETLQTIENKGKGEGQLEEPEGLAFDSANNFWVADWANNKVSEFNEHGTWLKDIGTSETGAGALAQPYALAIEGENIWVLDTGHDRLAHYSTDGSYLGEITGHTIGLELSLASGITLSEGDIWITNPAESQVLKLNGTGEQLAQYGSHGSGEAQFSWPSAIASDTEGHIWVLDDGNHRVQELDSTGHYVRQLPEEGASPFDEPQSIAVAGDGEIWIAGNGGNTIYAFQHDGDRYGNRQRCADIAGATATDYAATSEDVGHQLRTRVTATNHVGEATANAFDTALIAEAVPTEPPVDVTPPTITGTSRRGHTLEAEPGEWEGAEGPLEYQWQRCNSEGAACVDIGGATLSSYQLQTDDVGHRLRMRVTATNGGGETTADSDPTATIRDSSTPENTAQPTITGSFEAGQTLTAHPGEWAGDDSFTFSYQWYSCNIHGSQCVTITTSPNSSTYKLPVAAAAGTIEVVVTAHDVIGAANATSPATAPITGGCGNHADIWTAEGTDEDWATSANWSQHVPPHAEQEACIPQEMPVQLASLTTVSALRGEGVLRIDQAGGLELTSQTVGSTLGGLSITQGTLSGAGNVTIGNSLELSSDAVMSGPGATVLASGASGTITTLCAECRHPVLLDGGRTLVNDATIHYETGGLALAEGARIENNGVFIDDVEAEAGKPTEISIPTHSPGPAPSIINSGTFEKDKQPEGETTVAVPFKNNGIVRASAGKLIFTDGGIPGQPAEGEWDTQAGGTIALSAGTFPIASGADLTHVATEGATIERVELGVPPTDTTAPQIEGTPANGQLLSATTGAWEGTPPLHYTYQWQSCSTEGTSCTNIAGATGQSFRPTAAQEGHTIRVQITAANAAGEHTASAPVTAATSAYRPENLAPPTITGAPLKEHALVARPGEWAGTQPQEYTYQWERCNPGGRECNVLSQATEAEYLPVTGDVGHALRVLVDASNTQGSAAAVSSRTATVAASGPVNEAPPAITGLSQIGATLTADPGRWYAKEAPSFSYQWESCDAEALDCSVIHNGPELVIPPTVAGKTLRLTVTASAEGGENNAQSAPTSTVATEGAPAATSTPSIEGAAEEQQTVTADHGSWNEAGLSFSYQWLRCNEDGDECSNISGAQSTTYAIPLATATTTLRVALTATGPGGTTSTTSPATVPIVRSTLENIVPPSITEASGGNAELAAVRGMWAASSPLEYSYQWMHCDEAGTNCNAIPGATAANYQPGGEDVGGTVRIAVTASGNWGTLRVESSPNSVTAPGGASIWITGLPAVGHALTAQLTPTTAASYQWERCTIDGTACHPIEGAAERSYVVQEADLGHAILVEATPAEGPAVTSSPLQVGAPNWGEGRPAITQPLPGAPIIGETLTANDSELLSGAPLTREYTWERCDEAGTECVPLTLAGNGKSYLVAEADLNHTLRVIEKDSNSYGETSAMSLATTRVAHSAPVAVGEATIKVAGSAAPGVEASINTEPYAGDTPVTLAYQWLRCDASGEHCDPISGATSPSYTLATADVAHSVRVTVTADNAQGEQSTTTTGVLVETTYGALENTAAPTIEGDAHHTGLTSTGPQLKASPGSWKNAPETIEYSWEDCSSATAAADCSPAGGAGHLAREYTIKQSDAGSYLRVTVTATRADKHASAHFTEPYRTQAAAPESLAQPTILGLALAGSELKAFTGTWRTGGFPTTYKFAWQRCSSGGTECVTIADASGPGYRPSSTLVGAKIRVVVTATNGESETSEASKPTGVIEPALAPLEAGVTKIEGTPEAGATLTVASPEWDSVPVIEFSYQWSYCFETEESTHCTAIPGANATTYALTAADINKRIAVSVTARNAGGATTERSALTAPIQAAGSLPQEVTSPTLVTGLIEPTDGEPVSVEPGTWTMAESTHEQWQRCAPGEVPGSCIDIAGATGQTYLPGSSDIGYELRAVETATNGAGTATAATEASSPVNPIADSDEGLEYDGTLAVGQTITAMPGLLEAPELPTTTSYKFSRINSDETRTVLQEGPSANYTLTTEDIGARLEISDSFTIKSADTVLTIATKTDSTTTEAVKGTLHNLSAPTLAGSYNSGGYVTGEPGSWETDGEEAEYTYSWERCDAAGAACTPVGASDVAQYSLGEGDVGHTIRLTVTATTEAAMGTATSTTSEPVSATTLISNTAPPTISGEAKEARTLTASPGLWSAGPDLTLSYQWVQCEEGTCDAIPGANGPELPLGEAQTGTTIAVEVTASSPEGSAIAQSAQTAPVLAAPRPTAVNAPTLTVLGPPVAAGAIDATSGTWQNLDPSSKPDELGYQWERCATDQGPCEPISEAISHVYDTTAKDIGSRLRVEVTARNGGGEAAATSWMSPVIGPARSARHETVFVEEEAVRRRDETGAKTVLSCLQLVGEFPSGCEFVHPALSPDGLQVAVEVRPREDPDACPASEVCGENVNVPDARVAIVNYDGTSAELLPYEAGQPSWLPDDTGLLVTQTTEAAGAELLSQLAEVRLAEPTRLTTLPLPEGVDSAQSPTTPESGTRIAFAGRNRSDGHWGIYMANREGGEASLASDPTVIEPNEPVFAPTAPEWEQEPKLIYTARGPGEAGGFNATPRAIYAQYAGGSAHTITEPGTNFTGPHQAARGSLLATAQRLSGGGGPLQSHAWTARLDGSEAQESTASGNATGNTTSEPSQYGPENPRASVASAGSQWDKLARQFAPILRVDKSDGFLPIDVSWMMRFKNPWFKEPAHPNDVRYTQRCAYDSNFCGEASFPLRPFEGIEYDEQGHPHNERIAYPAEANVNNEEVVTDSTIDERDIGGYQSEPNRSKLQFVKTQAVNPQSRHTLMYYIVGQRFGKLTIDYWFYYTYNYFDGSDFCEIAHCAKASHDLHQGDWENVEVILNHSEPGNYRATPLKPTWYQFSRHAAKEAAVYSPGQVQTKTTPGGGVHVKVYAAHGDHANLPHCGHFGFSDPGRWLAGAEDVACGRYYNSLSRRLEPGQWAVASPALANVGSPESIAQWACWEGLFGAEEPGPRHIVGIKLPEFVSEELNVFFGRSPEAPLLQAKAFHLATYPSESCPETAR
jgi:sugar lactone lactonase YvrE